MNMERVDCKCQICGKYYSEDYIVPDAVWEQIKPNGKPEGAGLLCKSCILKRISKITTQNRASAQGEMNIDEFYKSSRCYLCGRGYPEVKLNIEGYIHHGKKFQCLDTKGCKRAIRKLR